ncbi:phenazine biosynthesis protein [Kitasatospora sp. NPDC089797]|uniref:phenazine biosynthesis protein n=1 Tax=Kitasatospora sp. NPDC089797 TaxID=3155298 RepID=UPI003426F27D
MQSQSVTDLTGAGATAPSDPPSDPAAGGVGSAGAADFDRHVRSAMAWHFSEATGSPFWLAKRSELGFDPLTEVTGAADLRRFPDVSDELRTVPAAALIPRGAAPDQAFRVYESGGTTGLPKRVVDGGYRSRMVAWAVDRLRANGVPQQGNWLHLGPAGPHVIAFDVAGYAARSGSLCYTVDLDPRWVKRLLSAGRRREVSDYLDHVLDQAELVLRSQPVAVLNTTPPLLEAICARADLRALVAERVGAIVWGGTAFSRESLQLVEREMFPGIPLVGVYGNSLMGVAPQRPRQDGDAYPCVFEPFAETTRLELVDGDGRPVGYGERGQVRLHLVSEEMFLPNIAERDTAIRVAPAAGSAVDGLAEVASVARFEGADVVEGVY